MIGLTAIMLGLMGSQLVGAAVSGGMSGNKLAKTQCENKKLLKDYTDNLNQMQTQLSAQMSKEHGEEKTANDFYTNLNTTFKGIESSHNTKEKILYSVQEFNNQIYRINTIFIIIFGTLFIVLLINLIKRQYQTANCPY